VFDTREQRDISMQHTHGGSIIKGTYNGNLNHKEVIQPLSNYKKEFNTKPTR
jgi:hypothetical protein